MDLVIAADTGAIKGASLAAGAVVNFNDIRTLNPKNDAIVCMCATTSAGEDEESEMLCASVQRQLTLFDPREAKMRTVATVDGEDEARIRCITPVDRMSFITAQSDGNVRQYRWNSHDDTPPKLQQQFATGKDLKKAHRSPSKNNELATCGFEHILKVWDLNRTDAEDVKPIFTAKNLPDDWLRLRVPIADNDVKMIANSELVVTATNTKELRLYDRRTQRRPVCVIKHGEYPFSAIDVPKHDGNEQYRVVAGTTHGDMGLFDWRGKAGLVHTFRGFAGAVRDIQCHPRLPYVASCSLDRFARVHNIDAKTNLSKLYCKARLSCMLWHVRSSDYDPYSVVKEEEETKAKSEDDSDAALSDGEDEWISMKAVGAVSKKPLARKADEKEEDQSVPAKKQKPKNTRKRSVEELPESEKKRLPKKKLKSDSKKRPIEVVSDEDEVKSEEKPKLPTKKRKQRV